MTDVDVIRIGLVGAGPWASTFHAPMIAGAESALLASVWARRPEAAEAVVAAHGGAVAATYADLLASCDAVAFAVPPDVQAELAPRAAAAGKHLLLEKPLAFTLLDAQRLADCVEANRVASLVMLRNRFEPTVASFLDAAAAVAPRAVIGRFVTDAALPGSHFATPWRRERGAVLDLGPHVLDLVEAVLGPVVDLTAIGDPARWVTISTLHAGGGVGQVSLSLTTPGSDRALHLEVVHESGSLMLEEPVAGGESAVQRRIMGDFVDCIATGREHPQGARRGLELQRLLKAVEESLRAHPAPRAADL